MMAMTMMMIATTIMMVTMMMTMMSVPTMMLTMATMLMEGTRADTCAQKRCSLAKKLEANA